MREELKLLEKLTVSERLYFYRDIGNECNKWLNGGVRDEETGNPMQGLE